MAGFSKKVAQLANDAERAAVAMQKLGEAASLSPAGGGSAGSQPLTITSPTTINVTVSGGSGGGGGGGTNQLSDISGFDRFLLTRGFQRQKLDPWLLQQLMAEFEKLLQKQGIGIQMRTGAAG